MAEYGESKSQDKRLRLQGKPEPQRRDFSGVHIIKGDHLMPATIIASPDIYELLVRRFAAIIGEEPDGRKNAGE